MLQRLTMWFDRKQSKYPRPSKKRLLYDFLHKRSKECLKDCDKQRLQTTVSINLWKIIPGRTGDRSDVKTASICTTELWDALKSFILISSKIKVPLPTKKKKKTPLISTYVFSGLATEQILILGPYLLSGGMIRRSEKSCKEGVCLIRCFPHPTLLCMFQRLCTYFQYTGVLTTYVRGMYFPAGHCSREKISVKTKINGYLFSDGYLFTGFSLHTLTLQFQKLSIKWLNFVLFDKETKSDYLTNFLFWLRDRAADLRRVCAVPSVNEHYWSLTVDEEEFTKKSRSKTDDESRIQVKPSFSKTFPAVCPAVCKRRVFWDPAMSIPLCVNVGVFEIQPCRFRQLSYFSDGSCWEIIIIKQIHTYTSSMLF